MDNKILTNLVRSPAGSGKTEELARRYIKLLKSGVPPERILTITFTEKAACEMKERIFRILKKEEPDLARRLKENILKLRISTIDSFCLSLIRTFSSILQLPPDLDVNPESEILWFLSSYDTLMRIADERDSPDYQLLLELISDGGFRGWHNLFNLFKELFSQRLLLLRVKDFSEAVRNGQAVPQAQAEEDMERLKEYLSFLEAEGISPTDNSLFLLMREKIKDLPPRLRGEKALKHFYFLLTKRYYADYFKKILFIFTQRFLSDYTQRKKRKGVLDFPDLEWIVYEFLSEHPEWQNILYLFDQHTDHILVDELQDTSFLQWAIIDKLTEEWRSGMGAKVERKIEPTLFLVGDEKQSIYFFRNAHSEIFAKVRDRLKAFLGERFQEVIIKDNFRSLKSIVDFANYFFAHLFTGGEGKPPWQTPYSEFISQREKKNPVIGKVEIILDQGGEKVAERRRREALLIAQRIKTLLGQEIVFDKEEKAIPASPEHFAILLRQRTHLAVYEKALRDFGIPYLVVKGIGFYQTPEVRLLLALLSFLLDPYDDFSLYFIIKSLFSLPEKEILFLRAPSGRPKGALFSQIKKNKKAIFEELSHYRHKVNKFPLSSILEEILTQRGGWRLFSSESEYYNMKKFIRICENLEGEGKSLWEIKDYFERAKENTDEPKADIAWEGMKAVRIMTVHAAKGLEFPIVFFAGLDEDLNPRGQSDFVFEEKEERVVVTYLPERSLREKSPVFQERKEKILEEEKRIFYVAGTRARDYLILTGVIPKEIRLSRLKWLLDVFPIRWEGEKIVSPVILPGLEFLSGAEVQRLWEKREGREEEEAPEKEISLYPMFLHPLSERERVIRPVTKETNEDWRRHGEGAILFGALMHKVLEKIARGELPWQKEVIQREAEKIFLLSGLPQEEAKIWVKEVLRQIENLGKSGLKEIILPQEGGYAELPFITQEDDVIYQGRIDRVIVQKKTVSVYDYKTYQVKEEEIPQLLDFYYQEQMKIYLRAISSLFPQKEVRGYLIFTALGQVFPLPKNPELI